MDRYMNSASFDMIHLCIDEYNGYRMSGVAYNNTIDDKIVFNDIKDLFLEFDKVFDKNGNPFSAEKKRSFKKEELIEAIYQNKPKVLKNYLHFLDIQGKIGSVDIVVKTRLYSNWQGIIFYQGQEEHFKDIVDLIQKIMYFLKI